MSALRVSPRLRKLELKHFHVFLVGHVSRAVGFLVKALRT
jgi:hypothetical protein